MGAKSMLEGDDKGDAVTNVKGKKLADSKAETNQIAIYIKLAVLKSH
jgi:hypothetical protein